MAKVWQQIGFDESVFNWLIEERIGRRHKNLSETVNEIINNYQYLVRTMEKAAQKQDNLIKENQKSIETIEAYKKQILDKAKPLKEV